MTCVMMFGDSGLGKSSVANLMTNGTQAVSNSDVSCTKGCTIINDKVSSSGYSFMDAQGTRDSSGESDEAVLRKVLRTLNEAHLSKVKVLWFVKPSNRRTPDLEKQAKFLASFNESDPSSIWKSVVIVCKKGNGDDDVKGAQAAARSKGKCEQELPYIGVTCVDWLKKPPYAWKMVLKETNEEKKREMKKELREEEGLYDESSLEATLRAMIDGVSSVEVLKSTDMCTKCGYKGDKRLAPLFCHNKMEKYHSEELKSYHKLTLEACHTGNQVACHKSETMEKYHSGARESYYTSHSKGIKWYHTKSYSKKHIGIIENYHSGKLEKDHPRSKSKFRDVNKVSKVHSGSYSTYYPSHSGRSEYYHDKSCSEVHTGYVEKYHSGSIRRYHSGNWESHAVARTVTGILTLGLSEIAASGEWECCYSNNKNSSGCKQRYKCCDGLSSNSGCRERWSCCKRKVNLFLIKSFGEVKLDNGCTKQYMCCKGSYSSRGCKQRWTCCNKDGSYGRCEGKKRWTCCHNESYSSQGCKDEYGDSEKWMCCQTLTDDCSSDWYDGCRERYTCCKGSPGSTGCKQRYSCCKKATDSTGCKDVYQCCQQLNGSKGCNEQYECCRKDSRIKECELKERMSCCKEKIGSTGCEDRHACCHSNGMGCTQKYVCCETLVNDSGNDKFKGCEDRWKCCGKEQKDEGCAMQYDCCKGAHDSEGCKERCNYCHNEWGDLVENDDCIEGMDNHEW